MKDIYEIISVAMIEEIRKSVGLSEKALYALNFSGRGFMSEEGFLPLTEIGKIESMEIARIVITPKKDLTPKRNDGGNDRRYRPAVIPANVHYYLDMKFLDAYEADKPRAIRVRLKNESFTPQKHDIRALQDYIEKAQEIICTP